MPNRPPILYQRIAGVIAGVLLFAGCQFGTQINRPGETTLERIQRTGTVRIAYANEAPFGYQDPETGRVTGEAPEIARVVLERMGIQNVETSLTGFAQLIPGLKAGRFDLIAAGMYITPARCRQIDFSNPSYTVSEAFLVRAGNPKDIHSFRDVKDHPDAILGVVGGTVDLQIAEDLGISESQTAVFPDKSTALAGLQAGRIDAFAGTVLTIEDLLGKTDHADVERAKPFQQPVDFGQNYGGFGFRDTDGAFRAEFNRHLDEYIGTPEHLELVHPFGFSRQNLPGDVTANELCREDH